MLCFNSIELQRWTFRSFFKVSLKFYILLNKHTFEFRFLNFGVGFTSCRSVGCVFNTTPRWMQSLSSKHIDLCKKKIGSAELAFEHAAWMSKQYVLNLFSEFFLIKFLEFGGMELAWTLVINYTKIFVSK